MTSVDREGYARLPEDLLRDLLEGAEAVTDTVEDLLGPALENRDNLREGLRSLDLIQQYDPQPVLTVAGVDGGFAVERTAAIDLVLCVAVGVEGLSETTTAWDSTQYRWYSRAAKHDIDTERLARGVMVAQELAILDDAPHQLRVLDGSHLTLVIQLNSALSSFSEEVRTVAAELWSELGTVAALERSCQNPLIVAMPKYDSSRMIADLLEESVGMDIAGDDKYLLGLLLEPGEFTRPLQVPPHPWSNLHFTAPEGAGPATIELAAALRDAIEPLKTRALHFMYFKPDEFSPAFRVELKPGAVTRPSLDQVCSTIGSQITGPFVREPYPQYLADVMAKSVGLGLSALQAAVQLRLGGSGRPEIAELLVHSYRTEGV